MFGLGGGELLLIFLFALIFIGPKKLPELAKGLGRALKEFQKAKDDVMHSANSTITDSDNDNNTKNNTENTESLASDEVTPEAKEEIKKKSEDKSS
jgi:sec-independent protein translocase protein TatA